MKSALELAMERFGGGQEKNPSFSREQKEQLAELDRIYEAKIVHARMTAKDKSGFLRDPVEAQQLQQDLALEIQALEEKRDREKDKLRRQFTTE